MRTIALLFMATVIVSGLQLEQGMFLEITNSDPFGAAVSALVQMTVQNTEPSGQLVAIQDLIQQLHDEIDSQQLTALRNFGPAQDTCTQDIKTLKEQLVTLKATHGDNTRDQNDLTEQKQITSSEIAEKRSNTDEDSRDLALYQKQLQDENDTYETESVSYSEALEACDEAIRLLQQIVLQRSREAESFTQNGVQFIQLSQKFEHVKQLLSQSEEKTPNTFVQPIIDVLIQLGSSSKVDLNQVQEIIALITTLRDRLQQGSSERRTSNAVNKENLNKLINDMQQQIQDHTKQIETQETRLTALTSALEEKDRNFNTSKTMIQLKQGLLDTRELDCQQQRDLFSSQQTSRANQIQLLDRLKEYFQSQVVTSVGNVE